MGFLQRVERTLDRGISQAFGRRSEIKPLDLAQGLRKECDDQIQVLDRSRTLAPNTYLVHLNPADFDRFSSWSDTLIEELERVLVEHAERQDYVFVGAVTISLHEDESVKKGRFETESRTERGAVAPATTSAASAGGHPILEIDGQQYLLTGAVTVIGRGGDSDIILEDAGVSRHHLELSVDGDLMSATDLGSTNGTWVDGRRIKTPVEVGDGSQVRIGRTTMTILLPASQSQDW